MRTGARRSGAGITTGSGMTGVSTSDAGSTAVTTPGEADAGCVMAPVIIMTASSKTITRTDSIYVVPARCP